MCDGTLLILVKQIGHLQIGLYTFIKLHTLFYPSLCHRSQASIIKPFQDQSLKADNSQKRLTSIHYVKHLYFNNPFSTEDIDLSKERVYKKENEILKLGPVFENFYAKTGLKKTFLWVINGKKILDIESFPLDFDRSYMIEHQEIYSPTLAKNVFSSACLMAPSLIFWPFFLPLNRQVFGLYFIKYRRNSSSTLMLRIVYLSFFPLPLMIRSLQLPSLVSMSCILR